MFGQGKKEQDTPFEKVVDEQQRILYRLKTIEERLAQFEVSVRELELAKKRFHGDD